MKRLPFFAVTTQNCTATDRFLLKSAQRHALREDDIVILRNSREIGLCRQTSHIISCAQSWRHTVRWLQSCASVSVRFILVHVRTIINQPRPNATAGLQSFNLETYASVQSPYERPFSRLWAWPLAFLRLCTVERCR